MLGKIFSHREGQQERGQEGGGAVGGATPLGRCLFWNFHSRQSGDAAEAFDNANVTWAIARLKIDRAAGQRGKGARGERVKGGKWQAMAAHAQGMRCRFLRKTQRRLRLRLRLRRRTSS